MALLFLNEKKCSLCDNVIAESSELISFPAFVQNANDEMHLFNDSAFHFNCIKKNALFNKALNISEDFLLKTKPENRICKIGGGLIKNQDDYLFIGLMSSDYREKINRFNFMTFNKNNLWQWVDKNDFINNIIEYKNCGKWNDINENFNYLDYLLSILRR